MSLIGLIDGSGNAIVNSSGEWLVIGEAAEYRLLKDHYINGLYLVAGEIVNDNGVLPTSWIPNANVDPLNAAAVQAFYDVGPELTGVLRTQWQQYPIYRPSTYWYEVTPNWWALTGLGSDQTLYPPRLAFIGRIE